MERKRTIRNFWWERKMAQSLWKTAWQFSVKLKVQLPYNPAVTHGHLSQTNENLRSHKTCTQMFITASFIIIKNWRQSRYPSGGGGEQLNWDTSIP